MVNVRLPVLIDLLSSFSLSCILFIGISCFRLVWALPNFNELTLLRTGSCIANRSSYYFLFELLFSATLLYNLLNILLGYFFSKFDGVRLFSLLNSFLFFRFSANIMDLPDLVPLAPLTRAGG